MELEQLVYLFIYYFIQDINSILVQSKCICVWKFSLEDLNSSFCPPHPTSTYICGVTIAPRVCGGWVGAIS